MLYVPIIFCVKRSISIAGLYPSLTNTNHAFLDRCSQKGRTELEEEVGDIDVPHLEIQILT